VHWFGSGTDSGRRKTQSCRYWSRVSLSLGIRVEGTDATSLGIQCVEDAELAAKHGVEGIILVSSHCL
jgi:hypothetical protein